MLKALMHLICMYIAHFVKGRTFLWVPACFTVPRVPSKMSNMGNNANFKSKYRLKKEKKMF